MFASVSAIELLFIVAAWALVVVIPPSRAGLAAAIGFGLLGVSFVPGLVVGVAG